MANSYPFDYGTIGLFAIAGLLGYAVFHGHRLGKDCFLCQWRGVVFFTSSLAIGMLVAWDNNPTFTDFIYSDSDTE